MILVLIYKRFFKKGLKKRPSTTTPYRPEFKMTKQHVPSKGFPVTRQPSSERESKIEKEIEESIKRARELLKK